MYKIIDALVQAIKNDEKIENLATGLADMAQQIREENAVLRDEVRDIDRRLIRLETFAEVATTKRLLES